MSYGSAPPPVSADLHLWAQKVVAYLRQSAARLQYKASGTSAVNDGSILWDADNGYPVVSKGNVWRQVVLADGYAILSQDVNITAAAANTAYKIPLDLITANGITLTGSPLTEITFAEGGFYLLAFTAQCTSTSGSAVELRFWPRINGTNVSGSTIVASLHNNGSTFVASRSAIFSVAAGDVLNVMWATNSTAAFLEAHAATAYAPASPSVTLAITRVRA
jgi:hypothetical protein